MEKRWVKYNHDNALMCPCCDDVIEIFTNLSNSDIEKCLYMDSDSARCTDERCDFKHGQVSGDSETAPYIIAN